MTTKIWSFINSGFLFLLLLRTVQFSHLSPNYNKICIRIHSENSNCSDISMIIQRDGFILYSIDYLTNLCMYLTIGWDTEAVPLSHPVRYLCFERWRSWVLFQMLLKCGGLCCFCVWNCALLHYPEKCKGWSHLNAYKINLHWNPFYTVWFY